MKEERGRRGEGERDESLFVLERRKSIRMRTSTVKRMEN